MNGALRCLAVAGLLLGAQGCSQRLDFERMRQQHRADPYAASGAFADGMAMRTPPAGTVPATVGVRRPDKSNGELQFRVHCAVCHGADASGASVMAGNMPGTKPPSLVSAAVAARTDQEIFDIVTHGRNRMPAFDWAMADADRAAVVAYVRTRQRAALDARVNPRGMAR